MSRQETSHLIQGLQLVSCSHSVLRVNLKTTLTKMAKPEKIEDNSSLRSISELYGERRNIAAWMNESDMKAFDKKNPLLPMSLHSFARIFSVGQQGRTRNKLRCHQRKICRRYIYWFARSQCHYSSLFSFWKSSTRSPTIGTHLAAQILYENRWNEQVDL